MRDGLTNRDTALYIYTSGTTGLPKAARIESFLREAASAMRAIEGAVNAQLHIHSAMRAIEGAMADIPTTVLLLDAPQPISAPRCAQLFLPPMY